MEFSGPQKWENIQNILTKLVGETCFLQKNGVKSEPVKYLAIYGAITEGY
jgi:hypothetical protein